MDSQDDALDALDELRDAASHLRAAVEVLDRVYNRVPNAIRHAIDADDTLSRLDRSVVERVWLMADGRVP